MKTLYLIRHGQTEWNVERRMQGRLDSPLTREGVEQAHAHGRLLKARAGVQAVIASPSGRTRETAFLINSYIRAPMSYHDALLERDVGEWSGLSVDEIEQRFPHAWRARLDDPYSYRPPKGENIEDMLGRCEAFVEELLGGELDEVALVTHQVMSRVVLTRLLGLSQVETMRVVHPNNLLYRIRIGGESLEAVHFVNGDGPHAGLLHQTESETIATLDKSEENT